MTATPEALATAESLLPCLTAQTCRAWYVLGEKQEHEDRCPASFRHAVALTLDAARQSPVADGGERVRKLEAALRPLEFLYQFQRNNEMWAYFCPSCKNLKQYGHRKNCAIGDALARTALAGEG